MPTTSVCQRLREQYSLDAKPGAKVDCPFCQHHTMSIKPDDTLAKCFHGSCGRFVTTHGSGGADTISLHSVLTEMYQACHQELLRLKDAKYLDNAYHYLVHDRKIHPGVVDDSMLGAIPSGGYNVDAAFQTLIDAVQPPGDPPPKGRGRPKKSPERSLEERRQWLIDQRDKLRTCLLKHAGWLAFFYTDAHHHLVAIRFRKPGTHYFTFFKPYQTNGLFGHGLFTPYELNGLQAFNEYLIVVEGEFNQLQLQSLAVRRREAAGKDPGYLFSCAVGGVDNTDWEAIRRLVQVPILMHDHDESGEGWVEDARELMPVEVCTTPTKDLDEYIRSFGDRHGEAWDAVRALIKGRVRQHRLYSGKGFEFFQGSKFIPKRLGDAILERLHLKYAADLLWVYRDGVYRSDGEQAVKQEVHALLGEQRTEGHVQETLRYIEVETYSKPPEAHLDFINVRNGRLDWRTKTLEPHTPATFDVLQIPVSYDPDARCPHYDTYLSTTLDPELISLADEINGHCLVPDTRFEKTVMFVGLGNNGKSVYLDTLTALLGPENVSHVALQDLTDDKFQAAELLGKLANIFADLDSRMITSSSRFKMLTTGDPITAQRKFGQPFSFTNYARMLFSANKIPRSYDTSYAFYRRWIVMEFTKTFTGKAADKHLRETLRQELPGIFNRALEGLERLYTQEDFTIPQAAKDALASYQRDNDTVAAFAAECLKAEKPEHGGRIIKQQLYRNYRGYCASQRWRPVSQREFKAKLFEMFPDLDEGRSGRNTGPWQWLGITYVGDEWGFDTEPPLEDD